MEPGPVAGICAAIIICYGCENPHRPLQVVGRLEKLVPVQDHIESEC